MNLITVLIDYSLFCFLCLSVGCREKILDDKIELEIYNAYIKIIKSERQHRQPNIFKRIRSLPFTLLHQHFPKPPLNKNKEIWNRKVVAHSIEDTAFSLWWKSYVKQNAQWTLMDPEQVHALLPKCFVWQINFPITRWGEKWCGLIAPPDFVSWILFDGWID